MHIQILTRSRDFEVNFRNMTPNRTDIHSKRTSLFSFLMDSCVVNWFPLIVIVDDGQKVDVLPFLLVSPFCPTALVMRKIGPCFPFSEIRSRMTGSYESARRSLRTNIHLGTNRAHDGSHFWRW